MQENCFKFCLKVETNHTCDDIILNLYAIHVFYQGIQ